MVLHQLAPSIRVASSPVRLTWCFRKLERSNQYTVIESEPQRPYWLEGGVATTWTRVESLSLPPELLTVSLTVCRPNTLKRAEYVAVLPLQLAPLHAQVATRPPPVLAVQLMVEPASVADGQVMLLIQGGCSVTVTEVWRRLSLPPALLAVR